MKVENFKQFSLKVLHCEARVFPVWYGYMISWPFFTPQKTHMHINLDHVARDHFVLGRDIFCGFTDYWLFGSKYASNEAMPAV